MSRTEFITRLKNKLQGIPLADASAAVEYFEEYFDEAGEENEQQVLAEMGSPEAVASRIIGEFSLRDLKAEPASGRKGLHTLGYVLLAIFASPIALPLALAAVLLTLALIIVLFSLIFALGATAAALLIAGVATTFFSFGLLSQSLPAMMFYIGCGLVCFSLGLGLMMLTVNLFQKGFAFLAKQCSTFLVRRNRA